MALFFYILSWYNEIMMYFQTLFDALMELCAPEDAPFYFVDHILDGVSYRVFTYRLGQYSDFIKPYARECRGHMFRMRSNDPTAVDRLVAMTMQKFFNLNENPLTMNLDLSKGAALIMDKEDGSLISSYFHGTKLRLKSKTALESEQAVAAMSYLASNAALLAFVEVMTANDWTVNMEFTSPHYRIVVPHQAERLTVLNCRYMHDGRYMPYTSLKALMEAKGCAEHLVKNHEVENLQEFINSVPDLNTGVEGYVVQLIEGETFKIKTNGYIALHRLKDSIGSQKRLFEVVVNEAHDDAKASFADDAFILTQIAEMESKVAAIWTKLKTGPIAFHNANKALDRKSFAILGQEQLDRMYFGLAMTLYLDKEPNYKEWMLKHYKELGIKDDVVSSNEEST